MSHLDQPSKAAVYLHALVEEIRAPLARIGMQAALVRKGHLDSSEGAESIEESLAEIEERIDLFLRSPAAALQEQAGKKG